MTALSTALQRAVRTGAGVLVTVSVLLTLVLPVSSPTAQAQPVGLPNHFALGVSAGQGDTWMPQSGIAWDLRFQYLVGGVNTNAGWETWNPDGTFALNYARESSDHGYIPVFPYYELLQSTGNCGSCAENQKDITNLNTPSLMSAYYQNFAMLMKRLGPGTYDKITGYGKTAVINIEPDFSGGYAVQAANNNSVCFGFCTGQGNDPTFLKASVASSGYADVAGYPNTYAGFVQALAHLRDLYAPNLLLGLHVSNWGAGTDIGADANPNTNAVALGQQIGAFFGKAGPHDVLFNDPLDRDAAYYKLVFGQNRWWDRQNVNLPNFHRWEQFLKASSTADGSKSILLWQVPVGNQYFDTENNTDGHYQDNRAEYIFGHIPELIQNGVIGVLFAPGNAGSTSYGDSKKDGVTNPASFCTTDGTSGPQICNNHTSNVVDDDGGYLRMSAQQYYTSPIALGAGTTPTPPPTGTSTPTPSSTPAATSGPSIAVLAQPVRLIDTRASGGVVQAGASRCFTVDGQAGVPANASGVVLNVAATGYTNRGWVALYPAGQSVPSTSTLNFDTSEFAIVNNATVRLGSGGQVCASAGGAATQVILDVAGYLPATSSAVSLLGVPARLVDTRSTGGAIQPGSNRCFNVAGVVGAPAGASGVLLNVTAVGYAQNGYLTVYPGGRAQPSTSTLNFDTREYAIANNAIVQIGSSQVCVASGGAASNVILDAVGYVSQQGATSLPLLAQPQRLMDTRSSGGAVAAGASRCFAVGGQSGIPSNATGALVNLTAVGQSGRGTLVLYAAGQSVPAQTTLSFDTTENAIANATVVRLGTSGQMCATAGQSSVQVVVDATGYIP